VKAMLPPCSNDSHKSCMWFHF